MDLFSIGSIVRVKGTKRPDRFAGVVSFQTCVAATGSGGGTCDRKNCRHSPKDHTWVRWPNGSLCSYKNYELEFDAAGEDEVLKDMEELLNDVEQGPQAAAVVKTILQNRRVRTENTTNKVEKVVKMSSSNKSLVEMFKVDASNAAYRVAAKQINTGVRNAVVDMMKKNGANNSQLEGLASLLDTEWGAGLIGMLAGHGLNYVPGIKEDPRVKRLAEEFRVASMATVGNQIVEAAMEQFMPTLTNALAALPSEATSSSRLEAPKSEEEEEVEIDTSDLEHHMEKEESKGMVVNGKD